VIVEVAGDEAVRVERWMAHHRENGAGAGVDHDGGATLISGLGLNIATGHAGKGIDIADGLIDSPLEIDVDRDLNVERRHPLGFGDDLARLARLALNHEELAARLAGKNLVGT